MSDYKDLSPQARKRALERSKERYKRNEEYRKERIAYNIKYREDRKDYPIFQMLWNARKRRYLLLESIEKYEKKISTLKHKLTCNGYNIVKYEKEAKKINETVFKKKR